MSTEGKPAETKENAEPKLAPLSETVSPGSIDLRPSPDKSPRVSRRAGVLIGIAAAVVLGAFAYGELSRQRELTAAAEGGLYKKVEPARPDEAQQNLGTGTARPGILPATPDSVGQMQRPDPELPTERIVVRRAQVSQPAPPPAPKQVPAREPTPEEKAWASAYVAEQQARLAPTGIRANSATPNRSASNGPAIGTIPGGDGAAPQLAALARALTGGNPTSGGTAPAAGVSAASEYEGQNLQAQKEACLVLHRKTLSRGSVASVVTMWHPGSRYQFAGGF